VGLVKVANIYIDAYFIMHVHRYYSSYDAIMRLDKHVKELRQL